MSDGPNNTGSWRSLSRFYWTFVGWQIVTKWLEKKEDLSVEALMNTDPRSIYNEAKV
jgi:hypothetical protein